jgi:hypothetical protein
MIWTTLWFKHQQNIWVERMKKACRWQSEGHQCYAAKRVYVWGKFIKEAEKEFELAV